MANRIQEIEVRGLLGSIDLKWHLQEGVNIISGGNGSGKSTLLRAVASQLRYEHLSNSSCAALIAELSVRTSGPIGKIITNFDYLELTEASLKNVASDRMQAFADIADNLFAASGKHINRNDNDSQLSFSLGKLSLTTDVLSSGEKQVLKLFLNIVLNPDADVMVLDEPEISLQIEWQKVLLEYVLALNPDMQILVATHSPAIVMNGWIDRVCEISDLTIR